METDVAIVGAGPGGAAAAIYLAREDIRTVIIEKDEFPRYHIGESLTGEVGQRIRDLGLGDYMEQARHPTKFGVNVFGPKGQQTFRVPVMERTADGSLEAGKTWQVPRDEFDRRLLEEARKQGARFVSGKAQDVIREGEAVRGVIVITEQGESLEIASKVVLDASGSATFLHNADVTSKKYRGGYDKQLAVYSQIAGGIRNEGKERDNTLILYKQKHHWAWFIPLSDDVVSVGVVVPSSYYKNSGEDMESFFLREVQEVNPELKRRLPDIVLLESVRGTSNYSYAIDDYTGDGFLCVGDSHRFIDPVFSFGLHFAVHEAELAAHAIAKHLRSGQDMHKCTFQAYQDKCDLGMNTIQELIDAFWNNPHAFAHAAHYKYKEDVVDMFAGRIYEEEPSPGLQALRKINDKFRSQVPALQ